MPLPLEIIILAAGKGTRMHSHRPKVLQELGGRPLLAHVLACAHALAPAAVHVVYGHGGERVPRAFADAGVSWVLQKAQKGTGHAVREAMSHVSKDALALVLYGDVPLIAPDTLRDLAAAASKDTLALLTAELPDPGNYGRILRNAEGAVVKIVEHKDAGELERAVREVNTGFLAAPAERLSAWLARLGNDNVQGEYYLTDIIEIAVADGLTVATRRPRSAWEILGVNSQQELAQLERIYQMQQAEKLMQQGVTLRDPARFDLRGELKAGRDVVIDVNVVLEGKVVLGDGVHIGPNNVIRDATIGAGTVVQPNCVIEESVVGQACRIGPFARLRPDTRLADRVHIGNFVEVKKSDVGAGSKINHLSYIGDTTVGKDVNIGAGTITCNYDGADKHRTVIGDGCFIGSSTQLVAPVTVGEGATIGAGSTIVQDAPPGELTLSRAGQKTVQGWKRPAKKDKSGKRKE